MKDFVWWKIRLLITIIMVSLDNLAFIATRILTLCKNVPKFYIFQKDYCYISNWMKIIKMKDNNEKEIIEID